MKDWMTLTEVAERIGVATKTIIRWEKAGKIRPSRRNWRGWRVYNMEDVKKLEEKFNCVYEYYDRVR